MHRRAALSTAAVLVAATAHAGSVAERRYFEPIEIPGVAPSERIARWEGDRLVAVPAQALGDGAGRSVVLAESVGASDAGRSGARVEIAVRDPIDGTEGYLYVAGRDVVVEERVAPGVETRAEGLRGRCYEVGFDPGDPALFARLAVLPACGGTGRNVLARLVSETTVTLRGIGAKLRYDRSRVRTRLIDERAGAVRVERRVGYRVALPLGGETDESEQRALFYPYHYVYPVRLAFPAVVGVLVGALEVEVATDWRADAGAFAFVHGAGAERALAASDSDGAPFEGWRMRGGAGTFLNFLRLGSGAPFEARLRNAQAPDGLRRVGFVLRSRRTLGVDVWEALSTTIVPRAGDGRGPDEFRGLLDHPLEVEVRLR